MTNSSSRAIVGCHHEAGSCRQMTVRGTEQPTSALQQFRPLSEDQLTLAAEAGSALSVYPVTSLSFTMPRRITGV